MSDVRYTEISTEEDGQRLDNYLVKILKGVPKSHIYRIIRAGEVRVNKKRAQASLRLREGDIVRIPPVRVSQDKEVFVGARLEQQLKDSILFEDSTLLVINKPAGIAVHGGSGLSLGVIEALRKTRTDLAYLELVHRLDKETSGCLLLAKKRSMLRAIQALLEGRQIQKTYWALLFSPWQDKKTVVVDVPLVKNILKSGERIVTASPEGKPSQTTFKLLENYQQACLVEASPKTGRTHQIRVHSAYLGHAIVGDEKYGKIEQLEDLETMKSRLYLHARAIQFNLNGKNYLFEANLDERFTNTLKKLRARSL
ncbi:RluA family pseudouridine synthase [Legionella brunensis]|uniref:Pseudouridine synthase n=1 Tax=Legionella brunensis TaxID=29422 RepID=A0A0W0S0Q1_9GAMM|nr:RluA family pseudouridine synthase [Legionella brunensis]KTC77008.1 ribosomal large subunit pseudouridine synthase [Legionella brunensis]